MAKVSIYVSEELRARMLEVGDQINWSEIARPSFEQAIANYNHERNRDMSTTIERLKASKQQYVANAKNYGKKFGREWAANSACYIDLHNISKMDLNRYELCPGTIANAIEAVIDPECTYGGHFTEITFKTDFMPSDDWLIAWVEGAQEVYSEVKDHL